MFSVGKKGNYLDESKPDANDLYGYSKSKGEINSHNTLTIRCSIIGREIFNHTELFEWLYRMKNKKIEGYKNVLYSGVTSTWMGSLLKYILKIILNYQGFTIYHLSQFQNMTY